METGTGAIKKRGTKVTFIQENLLVDLLLLEENKKVVTMKSNTTKPNELITIWKNIALKLNAANGPKKTWDEWRRFYVEWKSRTRKKAREYKVEQQATGGGTNKAKPLSEVEEKLMGLIGWVSVTGCTQLPPEQEPLIVIDNTSSNSNIEYRQNDLDNMDFDIDHMPMDFELDNLNQLLVKDTNNPKDNPDDLADFGADKENRPSRCFEKSPPLKNKMKKTLSTKRKKSYTSNVNVLHESASIYKEGAEKIAGAILAFAKSIEILANSINNYCAQKHAD